MGEGCLVDQLAGQYMAHICNLGYLANETNIRSALKSVMKYNYRENKFNHFNNRRSYVLGKESGLVMAHYPDHVQKEWKPFIYATETMTGFEYTAATGMIYENMKTEGIRVIKNIRDRLYGYKRNPFAETEAGFHYARAMASWSAIPALSGFHYSGVDKSVSFTSVPGTYFWSNGYAWGLCNINEDNVQFSVLGGEIEIEEFALKGIGSQTIKNGILKESDTISLKY